MRNNLDLAFDLIVLISLLIAAISGFKLGFLQSLFKGIGYITGGVIGVFISANYLSNLDSILIKVLSSVVIIATSWQIADDYIKDSKFYTTCDKYLPKVITDIKIEAKRIINL